ncbi:MAG: Hpt domain-containing protein, partial [Myxococcales bacterium]|nr:Hpt domain-containing protein [Myxococcales bacterium]
MAIDPDLMQRLRARYLASLPEKLERLESLRAQLEQGDEAAVEPLRVLAHRLAGSGASYGWPEISEAGERLEQASPDERAAAL